MSHETPPDPPPAQRTLRRRRIAEIWAPVALLLAAAAARVYGAWAARYITDADSSVVALMARHMAEGRTWPVFFYGQDYMGNLEPIASALMVALMGPTGFAVCLGTAWVAVAALGALYVWARDAAGARGALVALALCVVGPMHYFMFQFAPRGGYMVALLAAAYICGQSARLSVCLRSGSTPSRRAFLVLGAAVGLGLWSHPIVISAVLAATALLAIGCRFRLGRHRALLLMGLGGFVVGLAPWWIYNALNGWPSLSILKSAAGVGVAEGLRLLGSRWFNLVDIAAGPATLRVAIAAGYFVWAAAGMIVSLRDAIIEKSWNRATAARTGGGLFLLFSIAIFVQSKFATMNTSRYLIPLVPAIALFGGVAVAAAPRRSWRVAAGLLGLGLLVSQGWAWPPLRAVNHLVPKRMAGQEALRRSLEAEGVRTLYAPLQSYPLNFMLGEAFTFTDSRKIFYAPHYEEAEWSDTPGFLKNVGGISSFLSSGGGSARVAGPAGSTFHFDFRPPDEGLASVPVEAWESVAFNGVAAPALTDLRADTGCTPADGTRAQTLDICFNRPVALRRVRLAFDHRWDPDELNRPVSIAIEARGSAQGTWKELVPASPCTRFFWSGPRPFDGGRGQRVEFQLPGTLVTDLRIRLLDDRAGSIQPRWNLVDIGMFEDAPPRMPDVREFMPALLGSLNTNHVRRLYADRWESNRVYGDAHGQVAVELNPRMRQRGGLLPDGQVENRGGTGFLVRAPDAPDTRTVLQRMGWPFHEAAIGPWIMMICDNPVSGRAENCILPLRWAGYSLRFLEEDAPALPAGHTEPGGA